MALTITIESLDRSTEAWLLSESERRSEPVEVIAQQLVLRGVALERAQEATIVRHDLDPLAGTWDEEEAAEFEQATRDFSRIDETLWQ